MKLPHRRQFLRLPAGAAALPLVSPRLIAEDTEKWAKVIKFAGIKAD